MKTIKFQNKTLTIRKATNNIRKVLADADPSTANWYAEANEYARELSERNGTTIIKVCGIIAALSPQKTWDENKRIAGTFLSTGNAYHTSAFKQKAQDILGLPDDANEVDILEILNGKKISAFFLNIYKPYISDAVTVDRHAVEIAMGQILENHRMTANQYEFFVMAYQTVAAQYSLLPSELQAITWEHWRKTKRKTEEESPLPY